MVSWDNAWEHYPGWRLITCCHQYITNIVIIQHPMSDWHHPQPLHCLAPSLPPLGEFYLDFIEQTFANVDCVGAIYLMTVVTFCCWCPRPLLRTLGQGGWTMHRLLWLLLFPRSNNAHHQLDTIKSRIYGHKMLMLTSDVGFAWELFPLFSLIDEALKLRPKDWGHVSDSVGGRASVSLQNILQWSEWMRD